MAEAKKIFMENKNFYSNNKLPSLKEQESSKTKNLLQKVLSKTLHLSLLTNRMLADPSLISSQIAREFLRCLANLRITFKNHPLQPRTQKSSNLAKSAQKDQAVDFPRKSPPKYLLEEKQPKPKIFMPSHSNGKVSLDLKTKPNLSLPRPLPSPASLLNPPPEFQPPQPSANLAMVTNLETKIPWIMTCQANYQTMMKNRSQKDFFLHTVRSGLLREVGLMRSSTVIHRLPPRAQMAYIIRKEEGILQKRPRKDLSIQEIREYLLKLPEKMF